MQLLPGGGRGDVCVHWGLRAPLSTSSSALSERRCLRAKRIWVVKPHIVRHSRVKQRHRGGGASVTACSPDSCMPRIASADAMSDRPARPTKSKARRSPHQPRSTRPWRIW